MQRRANDSVSSTVSQLAESIRRGELTATAAIEACLARIAAGNDAIGALHEVHADEALAASANIDSRLRAGQPVGPLAGVPVAVKDNIVTAWGHTTCGSRMLETYRSPFTATAVSRLIDAGAIIVGKANCDEFAMGSSNENCAWGAARNPWSLDRVPGGSSGGSAAAVAAGLVPAALGSDTGGSVRQPASFCGVVGLKPTYGRVSRHGLVAYGSSLDQIGPIAHTVADAALLLQAMAGVDPLDATSLDQPAPDLLGALDEPVDSLRVGVAREHLSSHNGAAINDAVQLAAAALERTGATIVDVEMPLTEYGVATYYVIAAAEASSNLARFDGVRYGRRATLRPGEELFDLYARSRAEGFGPEVRRRIMLGTYVLSAGYHDAYYKRAQRVRRLIKREFDAAFSRCHVLLGPTSPTLPWAIGGKVDPLSIYLGDVYTVNANIAGIPAISLPASWAEDGEARLPVGVQLQAQAMDETTLLRAARTLERELDWRSSTPR